MRDTIELSAMAMDAVHKLQSDFKQQESVKPEMAMTEEQVIEFCVFFACISLNNPIVLTDKAMMLTMVASQQVATDTAPVEYLDMFRRMILGDVS